MNAGGPGFDNCERDAPEALRFHDWSDRSRQGTWREGSDAGFGLQSDHLWLDNSSRDIGDAILSMIALDTLSISVVIPCRNEAENLRKLLPRLKKQVAGAEVLVVDDGSSDDSGDVCAEHGVRVISHPRNLGNGAAIKTGARNARGRVLVFMDADGQHDPADIPRLLAPIEAGYEMAVGARSARSHASLPRFLANRLYNGLASLMSGFVVQDLTSGFRAVRARHFRKFLYLLPNGFSYPTTITMAFFRSGLGVTYVPIVAARRGDHSKSKIRVVRDGFRFLVIILKIGALFSPMRLFLPISGALLCVGLAYYGYTYYSAGRFTNMSAVLLLSALFTFLMGLISEQISSLHYKGIDEDVRLTRRTPLPPEDDPVPHPDQEAHG